MKIGVQFYTIREFAKDLDSLAESLKRVADIGYTTVQISGTCPYEGDWLAEQLKKTGLSCVITHSDPAKIASETEAVIAKHALFNCNGIGIGGYSMEKYDEFVSLFKPAGRKIADSGKFLSYHNHDREFQRAADGKTYMQKLVEDFDKDELKFTLDTYWVQAGGGDPIQWIRDLEGRIPCIHFKDMGYDRLMLPVGEGNMNFDGIIKACLDTGVEYALVEQDNCNGEDPFDCLIRSYRYLKAQGLS